MDDLDLRMLAIDLADGNEVKFKASDLTVDEQVKLGKYLREITDLKERFKNGPTPEP